jgi:hypothetical protein
LPAGIFLSSKSKMAFVAKSRKLIPNVEDFMFVKEGRSGVRSRAISSKGEYIKDFNIVEGNNHILNAPSPCATS